MSTTLTETIPLRQLVREVADELESPTRGASFVDAVISKMNPIDYEDYLRQALRIAVHVIDAGSRNEALDNLSHPKPSKGMNKAQVLRQYHWPAFLHQSIPTADGRKVMGLATAADLRYASQVRYDHAAKNTHAGDQYARLAELVEANGVVTIGEVDPDLVTAALLN